MFHGLQAFIHPPALQKIPLRGHGTRSAARRRVSGYLYTPKPRLTAPGLPTGAAGRLFVVFVAVLLVT